MTSATASGFGMFTFRDFDLDTETGEFKFSHPVYNEKERNYVHFNLNAVLRVSDSHSRKGTVGFFDSEVANRIHLARSQSVMHYNICPPGCAIERTYDLLQMFQTEAGMHALKEGFKAGSGVALSILFNNVIGILDREVLTGKTGFIDSNLAYDIRLDDHNPCLMHYKAHLPGCQRTYNLLELFIADVIDSYRTLYPKSVRLVGEKVILDATPPLPTTQVPESSKPTESIAKTKESSEDAEAPPDHEKDVDAKKPDVIKLEKELKAKDIELVNAKTELAKLRKEPEQKLPSADGPTKDTNSEVEKLRGELKAMKTDAETKELRYKLDLAELKNQLKDAEIRRLKSSGQSPEKDGVDDFDFSGPRV